MKKNIKQVLLGLLISLLGTIFYFLPPGQNLEEEFGLYWLYKLRGSTTAPNDVLIIDIGAESAGKLKLKEPQENFWPWPRDTHAKLIKRLHQAGAKVIVLDLIFHETNPNSVPEHDRLLAKAMRNAGNVIVVERLHSKQHDLVGVPGNTIPLKLIQETSWPLTPEISAAVLAHTPFPLPDDKPIINAYWTFKPSIGDFPTIPAMVLQAYTLEVYNDLITLLHKVHPSDNTRFLLKSDPTDDLESAMLFLRQLFVNYPEIGEKIEVELNQTNHIDARRKQLIDALIHLYSGQNDRYLNFYGPPHTIKTIPYYQFLQPTTNGHQPPDSVLDQVQGKVVFVGLTQSSHAEYEMTRDAYHTVFTEDDIKISGVEIAATAFANLLENKPVKPVPYAVSLALFVIIGFTLSFVFPMLSYKILVVAFIIAAGTYTSFTWLLFILASYWLPLITPLFIIIPGTILGAIILRHLADKEERDQLEKLFGKFKHQLVISDLTRQIDTNLRTDQLVFGACMFTDVQSFATLPKQTNLHQLRRLIDDYFDVLSQSVRKNNGVVNEIIGDAMLAIWETTSANTTLRKQACQAGLAINHFSRQDDYPALPTRIGIHFGELLVTRYGTTNNILRVIGNLVNTTSRIENANNFLGTRLLVTDKVIEGIDDFLTRPLGHFLLRNCPEPVYLYELIDYRQKADNKQHVLCALFTNALTAYQQQQPAAIEQWQEILTAYPEDGPTKFYLKHCLRLPPEAWQPTITFTQKS